MNRVRKFTVFALAVTVVATPVIAQFTFTTIDPPGSTATGVAGINPRGDIVGNYVAGGVTHGFLAQK